MHFHSKNYQPQMRAIWMLFSPTETNPETRQRTLTSKWKEKGNEAVYFMTAFT